jgi:prevent-host-death family protein
MTRLTATEASRNFAEVLTRVAAGEEIEVMRNGTAVARIVPARSRMLSAERFADLLASLPPVDDAFADDLRRIRAESGLLPLEDPWAS